MHRPKSTLLEYSLSGTMIATMPEPKVAEMLELAKRLAKNASAIALPRVGKTTVKRKADNSVVTETDHAIQAHILQTIAEAYPDHAVRAEEVLERPDAHPEPALARYCWIVDPLDGTRNYACGFPCFSTAIAVLDEGRPVVGVVLEHNAGLLYAVAAGFGATLNGTACRIDQIRKDADMLVGVPSSKDQLTVNVLRSWVATPGLVCRNLGSTAFHLGLVASGALAAAFCKRSKIWDIAAGALLVTETGGRITDLLGADLVPFDLTASPDEDLPFLAAAQEIHERLLNSIRSVAP